MLNGATGCEFNLGVPLTYQVNVNQCFEFVSVASLCQ